MRIGGRRHNPTALPPEKIRYPLYRRPGGHQGRSVQVRDISPPLFSNPECPAHSDIFYRHRYAGPFKIYVDNENSPFQALSSLPQEYIYI
jgi:hypothetical protein